MHEYDAHGPLYFISSSGVMQFREACYTVVSYAPYILLQIYTITILATFRVTIFEFLHPGPQPKCSIKQSIVNANFQMTKYSNVNLFVICYQCIRYRIPDMKAIVIND